MLNENIKRIRKSKGLSQEELAIKLNVVRQTVSKWENGLSVPDSGMLIILANELDTTVSELLGEPIAEPTTDDLKILSEKLEVINLQLAKRSITKVKSEQAAETEPNGKDEPQKPNDAPTKGESGTVKIGTARNFLL